MYFWQFLNGIVSHKNEGIQAEAWAEEHVLTACPSVNDINLKYHLNITNFIETFVLCTKS